QIEPVAEVPQITEQQAEINALQAQHEANLKELRAELEMQHQLAEKQAYDRGMIAGIEAAKSAEPTEEERALDERRQSEHRDVIARLEACVISAAGPDAIDDQQLIRSLHSAVINLASERAGTAIAENPEGISTRIAHLVERVKQKSETVTVALNPEDLTALTAYESGPLGWRYISDEALLSGDIRIMLDTIDISDVLLSDLLQVDGGTGLTQGDKGMLQVDGGAGLTQVDQDMPQVDDEADPIQVDQDMLQVDDGTDPTQVDQDITQAGVDDVPLEFKIVTTSTDEDAE
ncbi:FliH/SctL family protein, partial [Alphaproteobacteria bacterium]|nr:FliH/SctL family protein [Alphaproteobacteria bacterium]